jgi:uncharacterized Zn-binding protein involved in type VI secretion
MPPAARITDPHICPAATGPVPHVGGPILPPCFPTVRIAGLFAARVTDPAMCVGPPDSISLGSQSVLIGGLPAARMTDLTIHGGNIVMGCPTVNIGDPVVAFPFSVVGTTAQISQIQVALAALYSTPSGKALIANIAASGHIVTIQTTTGGSQCSPAVAPGTKSDTTVSWNPAQSLPGLPAGDPRSGAVVLGHELCHANHAANGTSANGPNDSYPGQVGSSSRGEERQTVGSAPPYDAAGNPVNNAAGNPAGTHIRQPNGTFTPAPNYTSGPPAGQPTENSIRNDFGFPQRGTYYGPSWPGGPPW